MSEEEKNHENGKQTMVPNQIKTETEQLCFIYFVMYLSNIWLNQEFLG